MKIVDAHRVPGNTSSPERRLEIERILAESNLVLRRLHLEARGRGFRGSRRMFMAAVLSGAETVPAEDLPAVSRIKEVEWEALCAYSAMIYKISGRWSRNLDASSSREDLDAVAVEGFLNAVCCFTGKARLSTYVHRSVTRHVSEYVMSRRNMPVPPEIVRLRVRLRRMMEGGLTLDEAVMSMGLSERVRSDLVFSLSEVSNSSSLGVDEAEIAGASGPADHSLAGRILRDMRFEGLDEVVFREFMREGDAMNLSGLAKRLVNPKTGRPYSRWMLCLVWRRVRDRISAALEGAA